VRSAPRPGSAAILAVGPAGILPVEMAVMVTIRSAGGATVINPWIIESRGNCVSMQSAGRDGIGGWFLSRYHKPWADAEGLHSSAPAALHAATLLLNLL